MSAGADLDWEEAFEYRPGQRVELIAQPGTFDTIADYEAMMVPPIWLLNDSRPRYPHELRVISQTPMETNALRPQCSLTLEKVYA
ncbi:MAG: hypothetical protein HC840_32185 [Leptolyngbyaceae cyanobacterium RM2_2_4]|nr:hypothetical protein [Leptolyngbyaceae cyanobacterium SM1_4_3]NJN92103.1 hypothetical protein [Leptolyngbyaceae cyanobacterium SL_5_14]NJO53295.1 hypothetical protein [Leptolyngbyaceae cyanobacterium RM2_2_4]NJO67397.1 hypothetical protein [Leptolyngbyaceae cyanobacterium RM1_405_57]